MLRYEPLEKGKLNTDYDRLLRYQRTSLDSWWSDGHQILFICFNLYNDFEIRHKDLHIVFIDLEKAYDKILMVDIDENWVLFKHIDIIGDIYDGVVANIKTYGGLTSEFFQSQFDVIIRIESILIYHSNR